MARKTKTTDRKNANGDGSIWQDSSRNVYRWSLTLGYAPDGKRRSITGRVKSEQEAKQALVKARADHLRGILAIPDATTLEQYALQFVSQQKHLRERSVKLFKLELAYALKTKLGHRELGNMRVCDIKPQHLKQVVSTLAEHEVKGPRGTQGNGKKLSPRTLAKIITRLRQVFKEAVRDQLIYISPADGLRPSKLISGHTNPEPVASVFDFEQLARFQELGVALHLAGICRMWTALFTVVSLGLRKGEAMGLQWPDIDFTREALTIRRARTTDDGKVIETGTKTFKSRRDIPMPSSLVTALTKHQDTQHLERERAAEAWQNTGAVFATVAGNWVHPSHLSDALETIQRWSDPKLFAQNATAMKHLVTPEALDRLEAVVTSGAVLPRLRIHDLRHTYATLALRRGIPVEVVSKNLGHSKISITMDIYRHVLETEQKQHVLDLFAAPIPERVVIVRALN